MGSAPSLVFWWVLGMAEGLGTEFRGEGLGV